MGTAPDQQPMSGCFLNSKENTASKINRSLLETTTCHGFIHISFASTPIRKIIWASLMVASLVGLVYNFYTMLITYFQYGVTTTHSKVNIENFKFPAVTVCNLNSLNKTRVQEHWDFSSLQEKLQNTTDQQLPPELQYYYNLRDYQAWLLENKTIDERMSLGYQKETFIVSSIYNERRCNLTTDFLGFFSLRYGNCFTFNHGLNRSATKSFNGDVGSQYGMRMQFFIGSSEYLSSISPSSGIRMEIHEPGILGSPDLYGFDLPVGASTDISIIPLTYHRLRTPYVTNCTTRFYNFTTSYTTYPIEFRYSKEVCKLLCQQEHVIQKCGCKTAYLPMSRTQEETYERNLNFCNLRNDTTRSCLDYIRNQAPINCQCQDPCSETTYEIQSTFGSWPSPNYQSTLINQMRSVNQELDTILRDPDIASDTSYIQSNIAEVHIYYRSSTGKDITTNKLLTSNTLFSNMGGQMGLWMGMSLLTICDFLEYFLEIVNYYWRKAVIKVTTNSGVTNIKLTPAPGEED